MTTRMVRVTKAGCPEREQAKGDPREYRDRYIAPLRPFDFTVRWGETLTRSLFRLFLSKGMGHASLLLFVRLLLIACVG